MRKRSLIGLVLLTLFDPPGAGLPSLRAQAMVEPTGVDSVRLHRAARSEQARFERLRRRRLPERWGSSGGGCDERIGRFCLTYDDDRADWVPPPEDPEVRVGRSELIDRLGAAAVALPGDDWVAGQLIRYLVEARRMPEAIEAAAACRGTRAWCAALAGYANHYAGRATAASSAFDETLAAMSPEERGEWTDLRILLEGDAARAYRRVEGTEKEAFERRFWALADPLLTRPGNELRSEHLARHVIDRLQDRAESPDATSWGSDLRELLLRYGWPSGWERERDTGIPSLGPPSLISHYSNAPQDLLPPASALLAEGSAEGKWDVQSARSRTAYQVPLGDTIARWFFPLAHQHSVFRRSGEAVVVMAYELPSDSLPPDPRIEGGLALLATGEPDRAPAQESRNGLGISDALVARAPAGPLLASLELVLPQERRLARARIGLEVTPLAPGAIALSDLLLIEPGEPLPDSLESAVSAALGSDRVAAGEEIGIYWEAYGLNATEAAQLTVSIRLTDEDEGFLRRLAVRAGILRRIDPIRLSWSEPTPTDDRLERSLAIRIPDISPGRYALELSISVPGREAVVSSRPIEVVAGSP